MSRKGPRGLSPEEQDLWNKVAARATPLHPDKPKPKPEPAPPQSVPVIRPDPLPSFQVGERATLNGKSHDLAGSVSASLAAQPVAMDRKNFTNLKRGKMKPEGRLDLHGMTLAQAHPRLNAFILNAHAQGKRLVLVITGKGKDRDEGGPIPVRRGVLKHQVPHWLTTPPLSHVVLQLSEAHLRHGGTGAYYVYLRRRR